MRMLTFLILTFCLSIASALDFGFSSEVTTLATADVRQTITSTTIRAFDFVIQNPAANAVSVFVGGSDVTTSGVTQGVELEPGASLSIASSSSLGGNNPLLSSNIFIISTGTAIPVIIGRVTFN